MKTGEDNRTFATNLLEQSRALPDQIGPGGTIQTFEGKILSILTVGPEL